MKYRFPGRLLRGIRAGQEYLAWHQPAISTTPETLSLISDSFPPGGTMPGRHAGRGIGDNFSPALRWSTPPVGTRELVLVMEDPDVPLRRPWVHLIAYGISPGIERIDEGALSEPNPQFRFGRNTIAGRGYSGPRALPAHGPHSYVFQLYALDCRLSFQKPPSLKELLHAIDGHVLARGRVDGIFEQK